MHLLDSSKLKEFANDNFKFDENGRKLSNCVENTVGKGEIACYDHFLLFPQHFQKACFPGASKGFIVWEWAKILSAICFNLDQSKILSCGNGLKHHLWTTNTLQMMASVCEWVGHNVGKEENTSFQHLNSFSIHVFKWFLFFFGGGGKV